MSDIKLTMEGQLSYSDTITIAQAAQIITFLNANSQGSPSLSSPAPSVGLTDTHTATQAVTTPREALEKSGARTSPEKIVALAAYLLQDGALETFTLEQVRPQFQRAREPLPKNMSRDINTAIQLGWVGSTTRGQYFLTSKAENVLELGFEALRTKKGNGGRSRALRPRRPSASVPERFDGVEEFPVEITGVPHYHAIKKKRDKMLWAIMAAKEVGYPSVTPKEIAWLTDHYGDAILTRDIGSNYTYLQKASLVNKTITGEIRITPKGEEYLRSLSGAVDE